MPLPKLLLSSLVAALALPLHANQLANPGFESGVASWTDFGNSSSVTGNAYAGTFSLRVGTAAGGRSQNVSSIASGAVYHASAAGKFSSTASSEGGWLLAKCYNASNTLLATQSVPFADATSFAIVSCTLTPPAGTSYISAQVWKDAGSRYLHVDSVVLTRAPTASFTRTPASGAASLAVGFNASTSSDPDGTIASYAWDFGDGSTGSGATTSHTYAAAGIYNAILTVTDNDGAASTASAAITVTGTPDNLLHDPGFELGNPYYEWQDWGNAARVAGNPHAGTYALQVGTAAGGWGQSFFVVAPGNTYTFSAWGKFSAAGTESAYVTVRCLNSAGTELAKYERVYLNETAYAQYSVNFTAPANTYEIRCQVWKDAGSRTFFVDDFSLVDTTAEPATASVTLSGTPTALKVSTVGVNHEMALTADTMSAADGQWMTQTFNGTGIRFMRWGYGAWNWHWQNETPLTTAYYGGDNTADDAGTFGLDEFLDYCLANNVTPLIILPFEAHAEDGTSPLTFADILNLSRSLVQHVAARGVTNAYFDVGNEPWVNSAANAYGAFTATYYASKLPSFYSMIKGVDSGYKVVASMHDAAWDATVYASAGGNFDAVDYHPYSTSNNLWSGYYAANGDNFGARGTANASYPTVQILVGETNVLWPYWFNADFSINPVGPPNLGAGLKLLNLLLDSVQSNIPTQVLTWPSHWVSSPELTGDSAVGFFSYSEWNHNSVTQRNTASVLPHALINRHALPYKIAAASNDPKVRAFGFSSDASRTKLSVFLINKRAGSRAITLTLPQSYAYAGGWTIQGSSIADPAPVYRTLVAPGTAVGATTFTVTLPRESAGVIEFYADAATAIPGTFTQTAPAASATGVSKAQNFTWSAASGATNYRLTVATSSTFASPAIDADVGNRTNHQSTAKLAPGTVYYWRVIATNRIGARTATNAGGSFTTASGN